MSPQTASLFGDNWLDVMKRVKSAKAFLIAPRIFAQAEASSPLQSKTSNLSRRQACKM